MCVVVCVPVMLSSSSAVSVSVSVLLLVLMSLPFALAAAAEEKGQQPREEVKPTSIRIVKDFFWLLFTVSFIRARLRTPRTPRWTWDPSSLGADGLPTGRPLVVAHRGASGMYPEHTMLAYRKAAEQGRRRAVS